MVNVAMAMSMVVRMMRLVLLRGQGWWIWAVNVPCLVTRRDYCLMPRLRSSGGIVRILPIIQGKFALWKDDGTNCLNRLDPGLSFGGTVPF